MLIFLIFLLLIVALFGGFAYHPLLFVLIILALVLFFWSGPVDGGPWYDRHWR